jgi:hypothetical protein
MSLATTPVTTSVEGDPTGLARHVRSTSRDGSAWDVTMLQQPGALAVLDRQAGKLVVTVGDLTTDQDRVADPRPGATCRTAVVCGQDGEVVVRPCAAPPALLVTEGDVHLVPRTPGADGVDRLRPSDRLLVLSAAAYETLPASLVTLLRALPARALHTDPAVLLETLFAEIPLGSGALIHVAS